MNVFPLMMLLGGSLTVAYSSENCCNPAEFLIMSADGVVMPDAGSGEFYHDGFDAIEPVAVIVCLGHRSIPLISVQIRWILHLTHNARL
jgi:hypothetical protein